MVISIIKPPEKKKKKKRNLERLCLGRNESIPAVVEKTL